MWPTVVSTPLWQPTVGLIRSASVLRSLRLLPVFRIMFGAALGAAQLKLAPLMQTDAAVHAGTLLRGQPYLSI